MKDVLKHWPRLKARLSTSRKLLLLDFDGTLAPIVPRPKDVRMKEPVKRRLQALGTRKDFRVAVISGRSLDDLKAHLPVKRVLKIGNHGLEMRGRGLAMPDAARQARRARMGMWLLVEKLRAVFYYLPGILIEDKGYTVSVHFRNLRPENAPAFNEAIKFFKDHFRSQTVVWRKGKKVWEAFPRVNWDKGKTALYLSKKFPGSLPIVVGDDRTDEDMFRALKGRAITIRVGRAKTSEAEYYVRSQQEVEPLLERLCQT